MRAPGERGKVTRRGPRLSSAFNSQLSTFKIPASQRFRKHTGLSRVRYPLVATAAAIAAPIPEPSEAWTREIFSAEFPRISSSAERIMSP